MRFPIIPTITSHLSICPFFSKIDCLDSLRCFRQVRKNHRIGPTLELFQQFKTLSLLEVKVEKKDLHEFDVASCLPCSSQKNNYNCGLFAAVVVAHVGAGNEISPPLFTQDQISVMKKQMVKEVVFDVDFFKP